VRVQRREPHAGISYTTAPDSQSQALYDLNIGWQEAPDPIRQSDFWAANDKIHPAAQQRITSTLSIGSIEAVMQDTFQVGKLLGYLRGGYQQFAGAQLPLVVRSNIAEGTPTTYGSLYAVDGVPSQGPVVLDSGMSYWPCSGMDGDPYS
jgi:hypothetical protein